MTGLAIIFVLINTVGLLLLPRRWAPLPLLVGACYMTLGQGLVVGPFYFTVIRLLVLAGFVRIIIRREKIAIGLNRMDWLMVAGAAVAVTSSAFHDDRFGAMVYRLGLVYDSCGIYFLLRVFCRNLDDAVVIAKITVILLIPVAAAMVYENLAFRNIFSVFGGVPEIPQIREGRIRAQGPFAHPILAGTVGAVCLPLILILWNKHRRQAWIGVATCLVIVFFSASSGPIMSVLSVVVALAMWRYRLYMRQVRWFLVFAYVALDLVMKAPAYYILARINIASGSTGFHRAALIEAALKHLDEWWLGGTDYTRHWMPTGVSWSPAHTDITNHYIQLGVLGGLPLMLLFIGILATGFSFVGQRVRQVVGQSADEAVMVWCLGAALFAHVTTMISVSYFDQSFVFVYLTLALIASVWAGKLPHVVESEAKIKNRFNFGIKDSAVVSGAQHRLKFGRATRALEVDEGRASRPVRTSRTFLQPLPAATTQSQQDGRDGATAANAGRAANDPSEP
jgi:hypothetical protein